MIISRGRRYIFVHAPKTGGTSLALVLEARAMKDDIMLGDTPKAVRRRGRVKDVKSSGRLWKHSMITDLYGLVTQDEIESFFVFTLVRNPWDRVVSYYHWLRDQHFDHPAVGLAKRLSFSEFLRQDLIADSLRQNPYGRYVVDAQGRAQCNLFLRLEALEEDLGQLNAHLGFALGPVGRVNASAREKDFRQYYDDAGAALVAELCAPDIARFGYSFSKE